MPLLQKERVNNINKKWTEEAAQAGRCFGVPQTSSGGLEDFLNNIKNLWKNPAEGNIAKTGIQNEAEKAQGILGQGYNPSFEFSHDPNRAGNGERGYSIILDRINERSDRVLNNAMWNWSPLKTDNPQSAVLVFAPEWQWYSYPRRRLELPQ